ncbi:monoterpene epsilon-lactone hydrolase [Williamsia limnetica]|uniref:Monoterpene epsilon-lactone hydrolase n=1 Tax=Williamsia limnetica TaxID=882452 RepID=A0A318RRT1_WILLI|nr:alpha/beta hydrolase [Williamsia limnetica]PYE11686.1 monoterpene epsilon-lactone hydrolase [Williamsia limnetica]
MASPELSRARDLLSHLVSEPEATMEDYRRLYDEVLVQFPVPADANVEEVDAGGVPAFWVDAPGTTHEQVVVVVHGGGFCMGTAKGYQDFGYRLSQASGARALVVDYRLAPENPFPAPLDDVVTAYRWARQQDGVRSVALVGDSAGGGIVVGALVKLRDDGDQAPDAAVACSPLVDLAGEGASLTERAHLDPLPAAALVEAMGGAYLGGQDPKSTPYASPLYADVGGLPPLRVLVGTDEGLHDDAVRLVEKVKAAGGQVDLEIGQDMVHIWPVFGFLPEAKASTARIGAFLRQHLATKSEV